MKDRALDRGRVAVNHTCVRGQIYGSGREFVSGYPELAVLAQRIFSFRLLLLGLLLGIKRTSLVLVMRLKRCRVLNIRRAQRRIDR